jgi:7,8-dihydroneopterin aldolase/epimerase/oxygenase
MPGEIIIKLDQLHFFAYHGLYEEERKNGNEFEVNLAVTLLPAVHDIIELAETVNYEQLYELIKTEMLKPRDLLETFVMEISEAIHLKFPQIKKIAISLTKLRPPIAGFTGSVAVKYSRKY